MGKKKTNKSKSEGGAGAASEPDESKGESKEEEEQVEVLDTSKAREATSEETGPTLEQTKKSQEELLELLKRVKERKKSAAAKSTAEKDHKFWNTQPVPQTNRLDSDNNVVKMPEFEGVNEAIEVKEIKDVMPEPYTLPKGFVWDSCDLNDGAVVEEVYTLLKQNYVEDDDNMFRFNYSVDFLKWALLIPGYSRELHIGVRVDAPQGKLVGFITGVPATMSVYSKPVKMVEINFLCVHKKLRKKRLAPVLIKEVTRRTNLMGIWQAAYTAGVVLPQPVASNRYFHRSLNPKKLIEIGFSHLSNRMTMARTIKLYKLNEELATTGVRPMEPKDVPVCCELLKTYLSKFQLCPVLDEHEFAHMLLPRKGVISSFVVEDPATGKVENFCSYYNLPSQIMKHEKHTDLFAAYSFYNVNTTVPLTQLVGDMLILASREGFDVFNALNLMHNDEFLKDLKFGIGDGHLQYYLYNWRCQAMDPNQVGLVLM